MKWSDFEHYLKGEHLNGRKVIATIAKSPIKETHAQADAPRRNPFATSARARKA